MQMDICSHIGLAATDNVNDHHGLCKNATKSTHGVLKPLSVDELSVDVTKFLNIQDAIEEDSISLTPHKNHKIMPQSPKKCLGKDTPSSGKTVSHDSHQDVMMATHDGNIKSNDPSGFCSISLPTNLKPVSAMKGSREKRGATPPVKLTVKWAPDVYDPIPTSVSHVVTNNRSSKHSKKNSKNKQKHGSKSSRGSKSKDKKQVRKRGGNSSSSSSFSGMSYKFEHEEELADFHEQDEHQPGGIDFHVGNSERLCGSSFMIRYGTSLHISSVAEAT
ncbi:hypothetical protein M8C21_000429 [Ambrosia artemisiifolia]|uniref:Uncharacterized protein n=1 Tax=Ambrosia artemisiifolia TaxID=4212 RepID=A0AAD5CR52_AMBAR|nr:hypothetical protein M8C21_000429 [Ambrosia artemisiifolia]